MYSCTLNLEIFFFRTKSGAKRYIRERYIHVHSFFNGSLSVLKIKTYPLLDWKCPSFTGDLFRLQVSKTSIFQNPQL